MIERVRADDIQTFIEPSSSIRQEITSDIKEINNKVSAGCGPSPDREIEEIFANEQVDTASEVFTLLIDNPSTSSRTSKVSIGTSPPPQSMSTQVILIA